MEAKIIRVFPTKTNATPDDELVRIHEVPSLFDEADEVHISVAFTWDIPWAEWAAKQWERVAPVKIGGPAYNEPGGEFVPGMYMRRATSSPRADARTDAGSAPYPNAKAVSFGSYPCETDGSSKTTICLPARPNISTRCSPCLPGNRIGRSSSEDWRRR